MNQAKRSATAHEVGKRAELAALAVFGIAEPQLEIKACCKQYYRVVIRAEQLEGNLRSNKKYCIVIYERPRVRIDGVCRYTLTHEESFRLHPITFYFATARDLYAAIRDSNASRRTINYQSYWHVKLSAIRKQLLGVNGYRLRCLGERVNVIGRMPNQSRQCLATLRNKEGAA